MAVVVAATLLAVAPLLLAGEAGPPPVASTPYVRAEDAAATVYNLAVFFGLLVGATVLIYVIFSRRRLMSLFVSLTWFLLSVGVVQFYAVLYYWSGLIGDTAALLLLWLSFPFGVAVLYMVKKRRGDVVLGFLSSLAGAMFAWLLPEATVAALLAALPIYDYFMVSRGLLGKLIKRSREAATPGSKGGGASADSPLFGFVVRMKSLSLGTGDFVVYAAALTFIAARVIHQSRLAALLSVGAGAALIYLGLRLTVAVFVKRWGYGPALPIPMLLLSPLLALALLE